MIESITRTKCLIRLLTLLFVGLAGFGYLSKTAYASELQSEQPLPERFLKADGKVLRNQGGKGEVVTLRGTNIGGWQLMEAWMCPTNAPDQKTAIETLTERFGKEKAEELFKIYEQSWWQERDFDHMKELNFNVIRLPISSYNLLDEQGKLREDTLGTYDWFIKECEKRDIYVIIDLHAAPGSQNGRDHSGDASGSKLYTDLRAQDLTVSLWEQIAEHYKGNPTVVGYDLLNEAEGNEQERAPWGKVQLPYFDRLYQAIRAIDPDHLIIINAVWEPTNIGHPSEYGWENVMYEYHFYCWSGTDNANVQRSFTNSKVTLNNQVGHEVPVLIGEFTLFDKLNSWEHALKVYEENGWSWTTWTYKTVDMGNWGIYNSKSSSTPDVNIYSDSLETIESKWSKLDTDTYFVKNQYLFDLLKVMADPKLAEGNPRKWYQKVTGDISLRAGRDAQVSVVSSSSLNSDREESQIIYLEVTGNEKIPTNTSRNVCIPPTIRNSVDATGLNYLIFSVYTNQGNRSLNVTLVDKNGATWSNYTSKAVMPSTNQWEKVFLDISNAAIDLSAIIEIRIGANLPGRYYFDDIYFAGSYADFTPEETEEEMQKDMGVSGEVTDWILDRAGQNKNGQQDQRVIVVSIVLAAAILAVMLVMVTILTNLKHKMEDKSF